MGSGRPGARRDGVSSGPERTWRHSARLTGAQGCCTPSSLIFDDQRARRSFHVFLSRRPVIYPWSRSIKAGTCASDVNGGGGNVAWIELTGGPAGIVLFVVWLLLPPLYV